VGPTPAEKRVISAPANKVSRAAVSRMSESQH